MNRLDPLVPSTLEELAALPVLLLVLFSLPLVALAWWRRIFPQRLLVWCMSVPCLVSLALLVKQDVLPLVLAVDVVLVAIAAWDVLSLPAVRKFSAERTCQRIASLGKPHRVILTVTNHDTRAHMVCLRDDVPSHLEPLPAEFSLRLPPRSRSVVHYDLKAARRGAFQLDKVYLRISSRLGLWQRFVARPSSSIIHVYPDMKQLSEYAALARTNRLSLMGVRRTRKIGEDHEFERLRDYTIDDDYKHIVWRATARRNKLTVKDLQASQSQRLVFLIDCGRMMTNEASGVSLLDHSLNAMLMLSFVALRQGDSVGMISFSDQIHSFVPPRGGMNQMNQLLHASFDRFAQLVESRYDEAFLYLATRCRKRSLVILITNVIDEVNARQIERYLSSLAGRHLPLGVLLRDRGLFDAADLVSPRGNHLYRSAAAAEIVMWRHQVLSDLVHKGALAIDVFPEDLTAPLVNQYLEIKARHLL